MSNNYFLISIIGLLTACAGALLGGYLGRKLADWQIRKEDDNQARPKSNGV